MIAGLLGFLKFGVEETGRLRLRWAVPWLLAAIGGLGGYLAGLYFA
jgi:hypothetical protein